MVGKPTRSSDFKSGASTLKALRRLQSRPVCQLLVPAPHLQRRNLPCSGDTSCAVEA